MLTVIFTFPDASSIDLISPGSSGLQYCRFIFSLNLTVNESMQVPVGWCRIFSFKKFTYMPEFREKYFVSITNLQSLFRRFICETLKRFSITIACAVSDSETSYLLVVCMIRLIQVRLFPHMFPSSCSWRTKNRLF